MIWGMGGPSGTVTFLFTDIEGSTRLWDSAPEAMGVALERHNTMVRGAVGAAGGYVFATGGDGFAAAFARAGDGLAAAVGAQGALEAEAWPEGRRSGCAWLFTPVRRSSVAATTSAPRSIRRPG
jgi:class 3 adenylate cyclase